MTPPIVLEESKMLGQGRFTIVGEGTLKVAVKRIRLCHLQNNNEEVALKKLHHPNVVKLFDVYSDNRFKYYALELCQASMDQLFEGNEEQEEYLKKMPPEKDVCLQLAKGLAYIHQMQLIHRDVKPHNVLIWVNSQSDQVLMKWADFEDCVSVDNNGCYSITGKSIGGTPDWYSPELWKIDLKISNETDVSVKSDVFSQGLVFGYYVLGGRHPYPGKPIEKYVLESNPVNLKEKEGHCMYEIFKEMLEEYPEKRISSAEVVTKITNIGV